MQETTFSFQGTDGTEIHAYRWDPPGAPTAIVQIAHGMGEHAGRYRRLAEALTAAGYVVYADDHRGHGRTAGGAEHHGKLGDGGWNGLVGDLATLTELAVTAHGPLPVVLIGHSMGSFALQQHLLDHSGELAGAVLSGSTALDVIAPGIDPTQDIDLSLFNAPFAPARTDYDWLSRDDAEVDAYVADPDCGFGLDPAATATMLAEVPPLADPARLAGIRSELPILIMSGDADPLAGGGALVEMIAGRYRDAGVQDVTVRLYPGARHEIFNETNRDEITADLLGWLTRILPAG